MLSKSLKGKGVKSALMGYRRPMPPFVSFSVMNRLKESAEKAKKAAESTWRDNETAQKVQQKVDETKDKLKSSAAGSTAQKLIAALPSTKDMVSSLMQGIKEIISPDKRVYSRREREERAKAEAKDSPDSSSQYTGTTQLINVEQPKTSWGRMKETLEDTPMYQSLKKSSLYQKSMETKSAIQDRVDDMKEVYETSQNPVVWQVREFTDTFLEESDAALAIGEIKKMDPSFNIPDLLKEMEEYMIPRVIRAFRRADLELLRSVCEDNALRNAVAEASKLQALGWFLDDRILDLAHLDFHDASFLDGNHPVVTVTFICQHVDCAKDVSGTIVSGSESKVQAFHYVWMLRKDLECPDFNYKIVDMQVQGIAGLL